MGLDREAGEDVSGVEREVHKRTSVSSTRFRQKNEDGSGCVKLYNRRSIIYRVWEWVMEISSIPFKISK